MGYEPEADGPYELPDEYRPLTSGLFHEAGTTER